MFAIVDALRAKQTRTSLLLRSYSKFDSSPATHLKCMYIYCRWRRQSTVAAFRRRLPNGHRTAADDVDGLELQTMIVCQPYISITPISPLLPDGEGMRSVCALGSGFNLHYGVRSSGTAQDVAGDVDGFAGCSWNSARTDRGVRASSLSVP